MSEQTATNPSHDRPNKPPAKKMSRVLWELVVVGVTIASLGGCAGKAVPAGTSLGTPVVHSPSSKPKRMTDAHWREIDSIIAEVRPVCGEPWFIYVNTSYKGYYSVMVYFQPSQSGDRVRRGEAIYFENTTPIDLQRAVAKKAGESWPSPWPYIQIVNPSAAEAAVPAEGDMPFSPPDGLTDEEIVSVVDTARAASVADDAEAGTMPVQRIELADDGSIGVYFGWQWGPLSGWGRVVTVQRQGAGFEARRGIGRWVS